VDYRVKNRTHMKIFVMERAVSFLLATGAYETENFPPFQLALCPPMAGRMPDVVGLDALKLAFVQTGDPAYLRLYSQLRDRVVRSAWLADEQAAKALV